MPARRTGLLTLLAIVLAAALAQSAVAAPYTVHTCRTPDGAPAPADGWSFQVMGTGKPTADDCASGGSLRGGFDNRSNHGHATSVALRFDAPPDTTIGAYNIDRQVELAKAGDDSWRFNYGFLRDELAFRGSNQTDLCQPSRNGCGARDGTFAETGLAIRRFFMFTDCNTNSGSTSDRCFAGDWRTSTTVRSARIRLDDTVAPTFSGTPGGFLLDPRADAVGVEEATFAATDRGSGLRDAVLLIDGRQVAQARVESAGTSCQEPYVRVVPCPLESRGRLTFDTATLPDGPHDAVLRVFDATGANVAEYGPVRINTSNHLKPQPRSPVPTRCSADLSRAVTTSLSRSTIRYGSSTTFSGIVRNASGQRVPGIEVEVTADGQPIAKERTGSTGRFSLRLSRGASRSLRAKVIMGDKLACSKERELRVRAGATLSLSRRRATLGQPIRFSGKVRTGKAGRRSKLVVLEVRDRGGRWQVLKNVRTDSRGRYRYTYTFRESRGVFVYRFRAQVPREPSVPYHRGYSPTRKLTVRGR